MTRPTKHNTPTVANTLTDDIEPKLTLRFHLILWVAHRCRALPDHETPIKVESLIEEFVAGL